MRKFGCWSSLLPAIFLAGCCHLAAPAARAADPSPSDDASPLVSGLIGQYSQGDEQYHHVAYLYDYAGAL